MIKLGISLGLLLSLAGLATEGWAKRYYPAINAHPLIVESLSLQNGTGTYSFETSDLKASAEPCSGAPDTRIVVQGPDGSAYTNDNYLPLPALKASRVSFSSQGGTFHVFVFAVLDTRCGKTDVYVTSPNGVRTRIVDDAEFGGQPIELSGLTTGRLYAMQTAHNPNGPGGSRILLFDTNWKFKGLVTSNGLTNPGRPGRSASLLATYRPGDRVVVGTGASAAGQWGSTAFIVDDCYYTPDSPDGQRDVCNGDGRDSDHDNLSDALEFELGTDSKDWDTDNDGLNDYHEVIGRSLPSGDVTLRAMGANPRRRDVFLEVDSRYAIDAKADCTESTDPWTQPLEEDAIRFVQEQLFDLPKLSSNPEPKFGNDIYLHVDRGAPCTDSSLCGDWGGSQNWGCLSGAGVVPYYQIDEDWFRKERWDLFRYALRWQGGTGQGNPEGANLWFNGSKEILAHELGHTLGLRHYGDPALPAMNSKVNYPSRMNYAFQGSMGFSRGDLSPINHLSMSELNWSAGKSKQYLEDKGFDTCPAPSACPAAGAVADAVDWNQDGRYSQGGVRFDISLPGLDIGGSGWPHAHEHRTIQLREYVQTPTGMIPIARPAVGGPGLVLVETSTGDPKAYAFYVSTDGKLRYSNLVDNIAGANGVNWKKLDVSYTLATSGSTAAAAIPLTNSILIVHPEANSGKLGWALFSITSETITSSGVVAGWPSGVNATHATLTANPFLPGVSMLFRDRSSNRIWSAPYVSLFGWLAVSPVHGQNGANLLSRATPGLAQGADGRLYLLRLDPYDRGMDLFVGDGIDFTLLQDTTIDGAIKEPGDNLKSTWTRINLLFLPFVTGAGNNFADSSGYLAAFYEYREANDQGKDSRWARAYVRGYVSPAGATLTSKSASPRRQYILPNQRFGVSIAAARHGPHAALLYVSENGADRMEYVPYANGIPPVAYPGHRDNDDAAIINVGLCTNLKIVSCKRVCEPQFAQRPADACLQQAANALQSVLSPPDLTEPEPESPLPD